jgi:glycosyltransferase involved in cell wall biosynthesis
MNPRTVLVLPAWYPTAREPLSGPFVRDHARAAASYGYDVVVFADEGPSPDVRGLFRLRTEQDGALTVVRFAARPGLARIVHLAAVMLATHRLAREGRQIALIHAHVHRMGWPAVLTGALLRRPVVISEHSTEWPNRAVRGVPLLRARLAFSRAAAVCPVSLALQHDIESYGIHARFRVVPNGLDTSIFHPQEQFQEVAPTRLVNVALHGPNKGLDVLLRAFRLLKTRRPELTLDLVGDGPLTPHLRELAAELGVESGVRFLGPLDPAGVASQLRGSHVFVLASLVETQCIAVMEALCCGLPVAATRVGGVPEVVRDGFESQLAAPNDPVALAEAVETVLQRYPELDRATFARQAAERFSLGAIGRLWDEIYRSV